MYRYNTFRVKKGYVLTYTLLIVSILMLFMIYSFTLELKRTKNIENFKERVTTEKGYEKYREYLLTELNQVIITNLSSLEKANIKSYFTANSIVLRTDGNKGVLRYSINEDKFYLETYEDNYNYRREVFDYNTEGNTVKFIFVRIEYAEGVIL